MRPTVSVLMAVHNGEKYLREAVESILNQTFTDFEFIIIDDGSTDGSPQIIAEYSDPRIKPMRNRENIGLTRSLNGGLDMAQGLYIARMDSDDVSLPERIGKQVAFMDAHKDVAACGTWAKLIDESGTVIGFRESLVGDSLEYMYWRLAPIIHPTVMIRAAHLNGLRYAQHLRYAQDFDLWLRLRTKHRLSNLAEYLLLYRVHEDAISSAKSEEQLRTAYEVMRANLGVEGVQYHEFLALVSHSFVLDPIRRSLATVKIARAIHKPYRRLFSSDTEYARRWLINKLYGAACRTRTLGLYRYLRKQRGG